MLRTYQDIAKMIQASVPEIRWADLDKGQLDDPESFNSPIIPTVLIGQADVDWSQLGMHRQQGTGLVSVKVVFRLPNQTHLTDPLLSKSLDQLLIADQVHEVVDQLRYILSRSKTAEYAAGPYYVVEHTYQASFRFEPEYVEKRVHLSINPRIYDPTKHATA